MGWHIKSGLSNATRTAENTDQYHLLPPRPSLLFSSPSPLLPLQLKLMEKVKFDACMTAAYSPRPNTDAAMWPNQVAEDVKQDRLQKVHC